MTINIPIETYKRYLKAVDVLRIITMNATVISDPGMDGHTDIYAIPLDDIEAAREIVGELR